MRVLMVSDVYYPRVNGVSTSIKTFRDSLVGQGIDSTLVCPAYSRTTQVEYDEAEDILRVPARPVIFDAEDRLFINSKANFLRILQLLDGKKYDLVHIQTPFIAHRLGKKISQHFNIPVVETYHTFFEEYFYHYIPFIPKTWLRFAARWFSRKQCNQLDAVVVPSSAMHEKLQQYGIDRKMAIIPTGIKIPDKNEDKGQQFLGEYNILPGRPIMLHVGRIAFEKNIGFLIKVYAEVKKSLPEVLFLIAGEGPAKRSLQKMVKELGLSEDVCFIGYLDRQKALPHCYQSGDVFVFSSRTETQGLVLLEAMAQGLPVVSLAEMGTKDILLPRQGAIVADEDVQDFSGKVISLLIDRDKHKLLSRAAKTFAATWTTDIMANKMAGFYQTLIEKHDSTVIDKAYREDKLVVDKA